MFDINNLTIVQQVQCLFRHNLQYTQEYLEGIYWFAALDYFELRSCGFPQHALIDCVELLPRMRHLTRLTAKSCVVERMCI